MGKFSSPVTTLVNLSNRSLGTAAHARSGRRSDATIAFLFLLPSLTGFIMFTAFPVLAAFVLGFTDYDFQSGLIFVGLDHYRELLTADPLMFQVSKNTFFYVLGYLPLNICFALLLATLINQPVRGATFFRALYFMPVLCTMVTAALLWAWMYQTDFGIINYFLHLIGLPKIPWLNSTQWPIPAIILMSLWKSIGYNIVVFLAGLQGIPRHLYEAASLDGATSWSRFWNVTLPLLSPTTFFATVMTIIASFQVFDQAYVMTNGGPANASDTIVLYIYQAAFQYYRLGYGAAIGWLLFSLLFVFTLIQWRMQRSWVYYE